MKLAIIISSFLIGIFILMIWMLINQIRFIKGIKTEKKTLDIGLIELKYRIDLIIAVFAIIVAISGMIGYGTIEDIKKDIAKDFESEFSNIKRKTDDLDSMININMDFINKFNIEKEAISSILLNSGKSAKKIQENIEILSQRNITNPNIYFCKFRFPKNKLDSGEPCKIFFKELKSINDQSLPIFQSPPRIINSSTTMITILNITKEYFEIIANAGNFEDYDMNIIIGAYD